MAEIIKDYQWGLAPAPRTRYPYDEWFDGQTRKVTHGVDFHCKPQSLKANLGVKAKERGLDYRAKVDEAEGTVIFRASKPDA